MSGTFPVWYRGQWEVDDLSEYDGRHEAYGPSIRQRGMVAFCECGWHPANHPGFIVADHLRDMA